MCERDKFLTEVIGECWHEPTINQRYGPYRDYHCFDCRKQLGSFYYDTPTFEIERKVNNNFSSWECFGKLWEWSQKQEWWGHFLYVYGDCCNIYIQYINPDSFAAIVYEYVKKE